MTAVSSDRSDGDEPYTAQLELATRTLLELSVRMLGRMEENVSPSLLRAVQALARLGGAKVSELADELDIPPSTASRMSDRLAAAGLATRSVARDNRRATWLELTSAGHDVLAELVNLRVEALDQVTSRMSARDRAAFLAGAKAFSAAHAGLVADGVLT